MRAPIALAIGGLLVSLASPPTALGEPLERTGLFGDIRLGGALLSARPSGLEVLDDNERLEDLADGGGRRTQGIPLIGGEIGYAFAKTGTTLAAGGGIEDPLHLSLRQKAGTWGTLSLSALYREAEVWENPYRSGVKRRRTDAEAAGFALGWDKVLGTGARIAFEELHIDVARDRIGDLRPELRRDGTDRTLELGYSWDLGAGGTLSPGVRHRWIDRDGASNSGRACEVELAHLFIHGRLSFATRLEAGRTDYDRTHPLFGQKREETTLAIAETVTLNDPFGWTDWYLFGLAAYRRTAADIDFFDSAATLVGSGLGYRF